jgi:hypothetical protein
MHDHRNSRETLVALDVLGQHIAVHFRHLGIDQDQAKLVANTPAGLRCVRRDSLQAGPGLCSVRSVLVFDAEFVEYLGNLPPGNNRIIGKEYAHILVDVGRGDIDDDRLAKGIGENLLDIENRHQFAVVEFGDCRDQP